MKTMNFLLNLTASYLLAMQQEKGKTKKNNICIFCEKKGVEKDLFRLMVAKYAKQIWILFFSYLSAQFGIGIALWQCLERNSIFSIY